MQGMGHKCLALAEGEHPTMNPIEYILDCINTSYSIKHKNGAIRRINVSPSAATETQRAGLNLFGQELNTVPSDNAQGAHKGRGVSASIENGERDYCF